MDFTAHCRQMLEERQIPVEWAERALMHPDRTEHRVDGTRHCIKQIPEHGNRWRRVVIRDANGSPTGVTAFFDCPLETSR